MEISKKVTPTISDYQIAYDLFFKKCYGLNLYLAPVLYIASAIGFYYVESDKVFGLMMVFLFAYLVIRIFYYRMTYAKRMAKLAPRMIQEEVLLITEEALHFAKPFDERTVKWEIFSDAIITDQVVLLIIDRSSFFDFHKHYFTAEEYAWLSKKAAQFQRIER